MKRLIAIVVVLCLAGSASAATHNLIGPTHELSGFVSSPLPGAAHPASTHPATAIVSLTASKDACADGSCAAAVGARTARAYSVAGPVRRWASRGRGFFR